jgi:hypothetical protein
MLFVYFFISMISLIIVENNKESWKLDSHFIIELANIIEIIDENINKIKFKFQKNLTK